MIQLDAHLDIYNLTDCTAELSHGNFLLHAEGSLPDIVNIGHRDLFLPADHIEKHYRQTISSLETTHDPHGTLAKVEKLLRHAKRVFLDIDCDVFDPAFFTATSHPMPFGLAPAFVPRLIQTIGSHRLAGVAISEFTWSRSQRPEPKHVGMVAGMDLVESATKNRAIRGRNAVELYSIYHRRYLFARCRPKCRTRDGRCNSVGSLCFRYGRCYPAPFWRSPSQKPVPRRRSLHVLNGNSSGETGPTFVEKAHAQATRNILDCRMAVSGDAQL